MKINFIRVKEEQFFKPLLISPLPKSRSPLMTLPPVRVFFPSQIKPNHTWPLLAHATRGEQRDGGISVHTSLRMSSESVCRW